VAKMGLAPLKYFKSESKIEPSHLKPTPETGWPGSTTEAGYLGPTTKTS